VTKLAIRFSLRMYPGVMLLMGVAGGCASADQLSPGTAASMSAESAAQEASSLPPPPPPAATFAGVPVALEAAPDVALPEFSGVVRTTSPAAITSTLLAAQKAGSRAVLRLVPADQATNGDGTFSLGKWKTALDRYDGVDISPGSDGTWAGHMLVQSPQSSSRWGGRPLSYSELEEMARYSRERWPGLPTIVQAPPSWLAASPSPWRYLDASSVVYSGSAGDVEFWASRRAREARSAGLGLLFGVSVLEKTTTAAQLEGWGSALLAQDNVCGLVIRRYRISYFSRTDVKAAVASLVDQARERSATSCRVRN
jgi:hypothetical protein